MGKCEKKHSHEQTEKKQWINDEKSLKKNAEKENMIHNFERAK